MANKYYEIESFKSFSESKIWQFNQDYYNKEGPNAWRSGTVPHHLTSNSVVGRTYAQLILAHLKDMASIGRLSEMVYIIELGAGHGRLAFHIIRHLDKLMNRVQQRLPPYCYVLTDIVEENLQFFQNHPQFQEYFNKGLMDVAFFDATRTSFIELRHAGVSLHPGTVHQSIITIGNYFFDSIPTDVFLIKDKKISECQVSLRSLKDPIGADNPMGPKDLEINLIAKPIHQGYYENEVFNQILDNYTELLHYSHVFFPKCGLQCIDRLRALSTVGLMVLSIDKGFHEIADLDKVGAPDIVHHGSMSVWVNFHAIGEYTKYNGGQALFSHFATLHLDCACFLFSKESNQYPKTKSAFEEYVNDYGPDDFYALKKMIYDNINSLSLIELITMMRMSFYDSTIFQTILPRLKQITHEITVNERRRLAQTMHEIWSMYFTINEPFDLAYELGGLFYDLGFYSDALLYFDHSIAFLGPQSDTFYNIALCQYQLREDKGFIKTLTSIKKLFPTFDRLKELESLNLEAV